MGNDKDWIFGADENYYKGLSSSSAIKCRDGSKKFNKSQFNDDFCDCPDGSDEPGYSLTRFCFHHFIILFARFCLY